MKKHLFNLFFAIAIIFNTKAAIQLEGLVDGGQIQNASISLNHLDANLQSLILNIKDEKFGAKGDGIANDTPAFTNALNKLKLAGGGKLFIPKGKYRLEKGFDGYASGQYEARQNYALLIDFPNIVLEGEGIGITILQAATPSTTLLYFSSPAPETPFPKPSSLKNISLNNITFESPDASKDYTNCPTTLSRKGLDPSKATSFIDQGWTLATMIYFVGKPNDYIFNINITKCEIKNPVRHGIAFAYVDSARVVNNIIRYYDGFAPPEHSHHAMGAGRCGIFSGSEPIKDILIQNNNWNGNVNNNKPIVQPSGQSTFIGADGFVWFAKGGNINIANNIIRNYSLECIHTEAAPINVANNNYFNEIGTPASVGWLAYTFSTSTADTTKPIFSFNGNTMVGGCGGLWMKGPLWVFSPAPPTPRYRAIANNNSFEDVLYPFAAVAADVFQCHNNKSFNCKTFFICNFVDLENGFPKLDFRSKHFSFVGNTIAECSGVPYMFQSPMANNGTITIDSGITSMGSDYHAVFGVPKTGESYSVLIGKNIWIGIDGKVLKAPIYYTPMATNINFL